MSNWAEIDNTNTVIRVLVCDNNDPNGDEGYQWLLDNLGGTWIKTSYNGTIRGNYAGINFSYLSELDIFMPPKCHDEATLNAELALWECKNSDHEINLNVEE
jgi:hypothetical protein